MMQFLEIEGHRLGVITEGEGRPGPPLILLHGIGLSVHFWPLSLPEPIRQRYRWYALTQPFHAPATFPETSPSQVTAELFSRLLSGALLSLVDDEPAILIGHSLGGFAALNLAAREPRRVRALASISGFSIGRGRGILGFWQQLAAEGTVGSWLFRQLWAMAVRSPRRFRWVMRRCAADHRAFLSSEPSARTIEAMYDDLRHHDVRALGMLLRQFREIDISPLLPQILAPVLIMAGDKDPVTPLAHQKALASAILHSELRVLKDCGHLCFVERPEESARLLEEWLARV